MADINFKRKWQSQTDTAVIWPGENREEILFEKHKESQSWHKPKARRCPKECEMSLSSTAYLIFTLFLSYWPWCMARSYWSSNLGGSDIETSCESESKRDTCWQSCRFRVNHDSRMRKHEKAWHFLQLKTGPPGTEFPACSQIQIIILIEKSSVADPDPDPDP
jgi:hypothetical protein